METGLEIAVYGAFRASRENTIACKGGERSEQLFADHLGVAVVRSYADPWTDVHEQPCPCIGLDQVDLVGADVLE